MGKINSQAKGKRAEREVAKLINRYLGTNVRRTPQSGGMSIKGDIIDINPDSAAYQFHFENVEDIRFIAYAALKKPKDKNEKR